MARKIHDNTPKPVTAVDGKRVAGLLRMRSALAHIAEAHAEIERAQRDLSSVVGVNAIYSRLSALARSLKDERRKLNDDINSADGPGALTQIGDLDRNPTTDDLLPHIACGHTKWRPKK